MTTLLTFIARISTALYFLAGIGIIFALRNFIQAGQARRIAVFGLEREDAEQKQRQSGGTIILLALLVGAVYTVKNIVLPNLTEQAPLPTQAPLVFVTQQATATQARLLYPTITPTIPVAPDSAVTYPTPDPNANGCEILGARITSPTAGQSVSGQATVEGEANILDFAQYKFEISGPGTGGAWVVVGTSTTPVSQGWLGSWDSTSLPPGSYNLRLVVLRTDGSYPTPCEVPIVITGPESGPAPAAP